MLEGEGSDARPPGHLVLTELPVHCLDCTPWYVQFCGDVAPHFLLEPVH